jgi:fatty acid desaturase
LAYKLAGALPSASIGNRQVAVLLRRPDPSQKSAPFWAFYGAATCGLTMFLVFGVLIDRLHHWWFELPLWLIGGALWGISTRALAARITKRRANAL